MELVTIYMMAHECSGSVSVVYALNENDLDNYEEETSEGVYSYPQEITTISGCDIHLEAIEFSEGDDDED